MPTLSELEEWIEEQIPRNLHDLPSKLHETLSVYYESLYHELTRYGSPLPSIDLSSLGLPTLSQIEQNLPFNCTTSTPSPPPPPPAPPAGLIERTSRHLSNHSGKYLATSLTIGLGLSIWYAYGGSSHRRSIKRKGRESDSGSTASYWFDWRGLDRKRKARVERGLRREAVVVLGADTPLGRSLALSLSSSSNLIVLCTISTPSAFNSFEALIPPSSRGYVKALLLDSSDPVSSIPSFKRDVKAALGLRWPSTIAGDPYARKGEEISLIGIVNCLSYLPEIESSPSSNVKMETDQDLELHPNNLTQLLDSYVTTPLCVISSLLPFLKSPTSSYLKSLNNNSNTYNGGNNRKEFEISPSSTVLSILPSLNLRVSLPGKMRESIIAKAVQSGMETLRRENEAVEFNQLHRDDEEDDEDALMRFGRRDVRFTTLTLSSGNAFSFGLDGPSSQSNQNPNISNSSSSINSDPSSSSNINPSSASSSSARPGLNQSRSSTNALNLSSTWSSRDPHTQLLMEKVSSLLLRRSRYKLPALQNLHLGFEKSLIKGRVSTPSVGPSPSRKKEVFTQAQIAETSHASRNTRFRRTLSKFNSRFAIFKAYSYSILGSIRNSTLHYLTSFSHFLIQDLSSDLLDFIIALHLSKNKRSIRREREKKLRELKMETVVESKEDKGNSSYRPQHRRSTIKQSHLSAPSSTMSPDSNPNSGLGSSPIHSAPATNSNPNSIPNSTRSGTSSEESEIGSSGSEAEDGYDIHSLPDSINGSGSQMTNSVEFDSNPHRPHHPHQRSSQNLTSSGEDSNLVATTNDDASLGSSLNSREDLNSSRRFEGGSVMGESWVRLSESENGRDQ